MIEISRIASVACAVVAAVVPVTAHADESVDRDIEYKITSSDHVVKTTLTGGTFVIDDDHRTFTVLDRGGAPVVRVPTRFTMGDREVTAEPALGANGTELRLVAGAPKPSTTPVVEAVASPLEDNAALNEFSTRFGLATAIGAMVGSAAGLVVGCVFGMPLFGFGCLAGAAAGAGLGGILGTIAVGGPVMVVSAVELLNTLNAPAGSSKWAQNYYLQPAN
ncbi:MULTISPECIES: hypothetical protein [Nocardia]|uniref:hypothetical protein n=1 Tax=Nocardia TaxID=1817 RepID=UPI000D68D3A2|nr:MULTISPECIES: hypothetical protein [Nocardia]